MTDSRYCLLVSDSLLRHGELVLDRYFDTADEAVPSAADAAPRVRVRPVGSLSSGPPRRLPRLYTVEKVGGHVHYFFPHAGSVLALPWVAAMRAAGLSIVDGRGRYVAAVEEQLQAGLAALLMGLTTGVFYLTARERLPAGWSAGLALMAALGTQIWSTASRVLWSDTWGVAILALVVWMLVRARARGRDPRPFLLGSLLAWAYFVRPTNSVHAALVLAYLAAAHPRALPRVLAAGVSWGAAFVAYSWATFGALLPSYFQGGRLGQSDPVEALLANLVSPSRGLLLYVPVVPLTLALLYRHRRHVRERSLAWLGVAGIVGQFVPVMLFHHWWGGYSYGPRLLTGMVPWVLLLAVLAVGAARDEAAESGGTRGRGRLVAVAAGLVCAWSVIVNGRGALLADPGDWHQQPFDVDASPSRVWDWRNPQFLAGLGRISAPVLMPGVRIAAGQSAADDLFESGWSGPEGALRWSVAPRARIRARWPFAGPFLLRMEVRQAPAWLAAGGQRLELWLDGAELARWHLAEPSPVEIAALVVSDGDNREHHLELRTADAPPTVTAGGDDRPLRTAVYGLRLDRFPALAYGERVPVGEAGHAAFVGNGWGAGETSHRWTTSPRADLFLAGEAEPAVLRLRLHPFLAEPAPASQRVLVSLDDTLVGTLALQSADPSEHAFALLDGLGPANRLAFELPDAVLPEDPRRDPRRLGVALHWLRLDRMPVLAAGRPLALGDPASAPYLGDGWAEPEGPTRWSVGLRSEVFFVAEKTGPAQLVVTMAPFITRNHRSQRVRVDLNGERLAELVLDRPERLPRVLEVRDGLLRPGNVLRLILPDARSPASAGLNPDRRLLGVSVEAIELR